MLNLLKVLIDESSSNSISYSEFMNTVLYDREQGYYMKFKNKVGQEGDFYTSSNIGTVFGQVFSQVFISLVENQKVEPIICEFGGGNGRFAEAVLSEWKKRSPSTYAELKYYIVEQSPYHLQLQKERLCNEKSFRQFKSLEELQEQVPIMKGILFSNEFFDAFPVDVVEKKDNKLFEVRITLNKDGKLEEILEVCKKEELIKWIEEQGIKLVNNQRMEIPIFMDSWFSSVSNWFAEGLIFTADYGYTYEEWAHSSHHKGSLRGYYKHSMVSNPLLNIGNMDLTSHIHLDAVKKIGEIHSFSFMGMLKQNDFLLSAGILNILQEHQDTDPFSKKSKQNRAIRSLIIDGGISSSFHIIIQQKNIRLDLTEVLPNLHVK